MFYDQQELAIKVFLSSISELSHIGFVSSEWQHENALRFYQHRLRHVSSDVTIAYGETNNHLFVELAGKACNNLDATDILQPLIAATYGRCSRIDFAVDIECKTPPKEFIEQRGNQSFKSSGNKYSPTGGTEYIGGRTSERMARVYRYYEPHPRSAFLRVEAEYKGDAAKVAAKHFASSGLLKACVDAHYPFKWEHEQWKPDDRATKMPYKSYNPSNANTIRWLYGDVITALRKAIKADVIDLDEWLKVLKSKDNTSFDE
jgi:hypothetical protein